MDQLLGYTVAKQYVLTRLLGEGGMGRVYLGRELSTHRKVAVKLLQESLSEDPFFVSRMEREASAVRRVVHPNSVRLLDFGQDKLGVYLVMEYLEGESLWTRLEKRGRLSPQEAVSLLCQILLPLSLCHAQGVVHRDLKPDNIMLCKEGQREVAKLLDFGIARLEDGPAVTKTGQILGTPAYMSPEQISGRGIGPASDIYALGILLYELLTGRLPFEASSQLELFRQHIREPAPLLAQACPQDRRLAPFEPVVKKALSKSPQDRFLCAEDMGDALSRAFWQSQQMMAFLPKEAESSHADKKDPQGRASQTECELAEGALLDETWEEASWAFGDIPQPAHDFPLTPHIRATLLLSEDLPEEFPHATLPSVEEGQKDAVPLPADAPPQMEDEGLLSEFSLGEQDFTLPMTKEAILKALSPQEPCTLTGAEGDGSVCQVAATEKMPALSPQETTLFPVLAFERTFHLLPAASTWWQAIYLAPVWLFLLAARVGRTLLGR